MRRITIRRKQTGLALALLAFAAVCWDLAISVTTAIEEGTYKMESEFDAVTAATTKVSTFLCLT